ncbi:MAG: IS1634 family transposase [Sphaerochaeta sp.]
MQQVIKAVKSTQLSFKHYPILSAFFKQYGLFEFFDSLLPKRRHHDVTHGQCILLFVCDCLTTRTPLYLYTDLLRDLDVPYIFGPGARAEYFNEYTMGETLDAIVKFGEDKLFAKVLEHLRQQVDIDMAHLHADTSNFSVAGEYYDGGATPTGLHITYGHAKDKRTDLKRWALLLIVNAMGIPVAMKTLDGNSSDKNTIIEGMTALKEALQAEEMAEVTSTFIADSSFYTRDNIATFSGKWISHAQESLNEVKRYLAMEALPFVESQAQGYSTYGLDSSYGGVDQRWVLVHSDQMYKRQANTLQRKQEKQLKDASAKAYHLQAKTFKCEPDALAAAAELGKEWPLLKAMEPEVSTKTANKAGKKGRPKAGEGVEIFSVSLAFEKDPQAFEDACKGIGKFMLATNDLTLGDEQILQAYKQQGTVERGFRFLKNGDFQLTPVFLKSPRRIQALSFVMCLSLMVYSIIENQLRTSLARANETIRIQDNGPANYKNNAKPTLMKIFAMFDHLGTTSITMAGGQQMLIQTTLPPEVRKVLYYLGSPYEKAFERSI